MSGVAKTEIAQSVAQAGYFNISREDLPDFAEVATKAGVAFRMPMAEAGEKLGQLSNAYNFNPASRRLAADAVNTIGDTAGTSERNVINFASRISGVAQMYRLPFAKGAAFGGGVMGMGVEPDVAATGFTALLTKLGTADQSTDKDFHRGLGRIGLNGRRVKAMINQDPELALRDVLERINKLPQERKAGVVADLAGVEHGPAIARMAESLPKIAAALERVRDAASYSGSLERTFKIFSSDTQAALNRADANLGALTAKIGQRFTPAVKEAANVTSRWLNGMIKAMELADRASALAAKQLKGEALSKPEQDELAANPKLKAETDRRVASGREDAERRAIVEEEGRSRGARPRDPAAPARAARSRQPDEQDAAAAEARERTRQRMDAEIKGLAADIETRRAGGFETTADRRRLRSLRQQYDRQFPAPAAPIAREPERSAEPATLRPRPSPARPRRARPCRRRLPASSPRCRLPPRRSRASRSGRTPRPLRRQRSASNPRSQMTPASASRAITTPSSAAWSARSAWCTTPASGCAKTWRSGPRSTSRR